ncbi:MAG TPA: MBL fold metallo-hydrolase [Chthoniobacterales bacterium]
MALIFERIQTAGIAALSYLIGDDKEHTAAVIDPRRDVEIYLELARKANVSITHIFETHIHADLVSGARELAARTQTAKVHASVEGGAAYAFEVEPVKEGNRYAFGEMVLIARHTPGHTPEHMSYVAAEQAHPDSPWGVFTGDSLFVSSAGRPDLLGKDADKLAAQLYDTFFNVFGNLEEGVILFPGHGHGSPCGADIGDRLESTIGYEKRFNPYFQKTDRNAFVDLALSTAPPEPTYYRRMKKLGGLAARPGKANPAGARSGSGTRKRPAAFRAHRLHAVRRLPGRRDDGMGQRRFSAPRHSAGDGARRKDRLRRFAGA